MIIKTDVEENGYQLPNEEIVNLTYRWEVMTDVFFKEFKGGMDTGRAVE
jgi:hypothetical protein